MKFIRKFPVTDADSLESPQKFEGFFLDYYPRVKGFINGLLQDAEEAEDLSQDIFMSLWQNRGNLKQIDNLDAYLFRIARNAVYRSALCYLKIINPGSYRMITPICMK